MGAAPTSPKTRLVLEPPWHASPTALASTLCFVSTGLEPLRRTSKFQSQLFDWTPPPPTPPQALSLPSRLPPMCEAGFQVKLRHDLLPGKCRFTSTGVSATHAHTFTSLATQKQLECTLVSGKSKEESQAAGSRFSAVSLRHSTTCPAASEW